MSCLEKKTFEEGGRKEESVSKKKIPLKIFFFLLSIENAHSNPFFFQMIS